MVDGNVDVDVDVNVNIDVDVDQPSSNLDELPYVEILIYLDQILVLM